MNATLKGCPSPQEFGLPEQFERFRPIQEEALSALEYPQRFITLCAPTGSGKSAVVVADALRSGEPTCIVTSTRGLQTQYMDDFKSIGMVDIRGKANYQCHMKEEYTCEDGCVAKCPYRGTVNCPSSQAEMAASCSSLVVTNYAKWTASRKYGQGMSHFTRVIFDEAHNCPSAIAQAMQVVLHHREIEETLKLDFPGSPQNQEMECWKAWAYEAKSTAEALAIVTQEKINRASDPKPAWVRQLTHMKNLVRRLSIIQTARPSEWVVDEWEKGFIFDPIRPGRYAESTLFLRMPKVVMVSATLRPKTMFMCGVGKDQFHFREFPSEFDRKRCPIYYIPTMRVDRRAGDLGMLWAMLDRIAARRREVKGLVHTVSYARQQEIQERSRFYASMIINPKGEPAIETVERFFESGPGTILVSPTVGEGYDFKHGRARWQLLCKIPFEPPSKIVKAREADDPEYRAYQAIQYMVQVFGRIMRDKSDWGESFIGDSHLDWFLPRYGYLAPKSFHGFYQRMEHLPPPLSF